jgi:hypothetical protein
VPASDRRLQDPAVRHELLVRATLPGLGRDAAVSHASAAVLWGLPLWKVPLKRVHLTRMQHSGGRVGRAVHLHTGQLAVDEMAEVGGVAVTSPTRTVVDLARTVSFESAVVTADAALHDGLVDAAGLAAAMARAAGSRGCPAARRVIAFANGRSESVGESRSRVALSRAGVPAPTPQWEVWCGRTLLGRCDFGWPERSAVGEFDGKVKYGRLLRPGQDPGKVVFEEKIREDALRAQGLNVVRWTWRELDDFAEAAVRIRRALGIT